MRISELQEHLSEVLGENGDLEVTIETDDPDWAAGVDKLVVLRDENQAVYLMIGTDDAKQTNTTLQ